MIINKYERNYFETIVSNSDNITDVAKNLGLKPFCGNRNTINKYIKLYCIDTTHFKQCYSGSSRNLLSKRTLNEILVVNSNYDTTNLKERLYKEGIKERICELCGQDESWCGKKMSLILDHINGIKNDLRIENLRIVCPNCNATLPTHCRGSVKTKKIKNKKHIDRSLNQRKVKRPPLEQLQSEINELGYSGTGRKYGVSDNAIRKWVIFYNIHK